MTSEVVASIPVGGPVVNDDFFSIVPDSNFDMCMVFSLDLDRFTFYKVETLF